MPSTIARRLVCFDVLGAWLGPEEALAAVESVAEMFGESTLGTAALVRRLTTDRIPRGTLFSRLAPAFHALDGNAKVFDDSCYLDPFRVHIEAVRGCVSLLDRLAVGRPSIDNIAGAVVAGELDRFVRDIGAANALTRRLGDAMRSLPTDIPPWLPLQVLRNMLHGVYTRSCVALGPPQADRLFSDSLTAAGSGLSGFDVRGLL